MHQTQWSPERPLPPPVSLAPESGRPRASLPPPPLDPRVEAAPGVSPASRPASTVSPAPLPSPSLLRCGSQTGAWFSVCVHSLQHRLELGQSLISLWA